MAANEQLQTRQDFERRQSELRQVYAERWPELKRRLEEIDAKRCVSNPQLLNLTAHKYPEARIRLAVVGMQTNDWVTGKPVPSVDELLDEYARFNLWRKYMHTPIARAAHELYRLLNPSGPDNGFICTNVYKVDENNRRPGPDVAAILDSCLDVLAKEIQLAAPHVAVFFTGPSHDDRLRSSFPGLEFCQPTDRNKRVLARLKHSNLPWDSFRTYHPNCLRRDRWKQGLWQVLQEIANLVHAT